MHSSDYCFFLKSPAVSLSSLPSVPYSLLGLPTDSTVQQWSLLYWTRGAIHRQQRRHLQNPHQHRQPSRCLPSWARSDPYSFLWRSSRWPSRIQRDTTSFENATGTASMAYCTLSPCHRPLPESFWLFGVYPTHPSLQECCSRLWRHFTSISTWPMRLTRWVRGCFMFCTWQYGSVCITLCINAATTTPAYDLSRWASFWFWSMLGDSKLLVMDCLSSITGKNVVNIMAGKLPRNQSGLCLTQLSMFVS